ncbi:MAG TPA: ABC transporter permease [Candidatus Bathyarchaeia archaeon]|nr:ABC transporter permease [Candidatus Bathyarchaeia archaeon]
MSSKSYIVRRLLQTIPSVLIVLMVNFCIVRFAPGDPAQLIAGEGATEAQVALISHSLGLDKPLPEQLVTYFQGILHGDLGYSYLQGRPVWDLVMERIPNTLMLVIAALLLAIAFGVTLGVIAANKPYSLLDNAVTVISLTSYAMPAFWIAQMLLLAFAIYLPIFPAGGMTNVRNTSSGLMYVSDVAWHAILPIATLTLVYIAEQFRLTRSRMLEVLSQDYITTARAKGVKERGVLFKHALRNALLPVVTITGLRMGTFFTGAILTEFVYGWPGVGRLMFDSVFSRDYPVILGCFAFISIFVIVGSLIIDLLYAELDPRIRYR